LNNLSKNWICGLGLESIEELGENRDLENILDQNYNQGVSDWEKLGRKIYWSRLCGNWVRIFQKLKKEF